MSAVAASVAETASPSDSAAILADNARCRFNLLEPGPDGVDKYHINTHVAFFRPIAGTTPQALTARLLREFPPTFSPGNIATVVRAPCRFSNRPTLKFTGKVPGPDLHDDWVALDWKGTNFVASTLERLWWERWEVAARAASRVMPTIPTVFGRLALDVNRRHFLAGRRSWHVGALRQQNLWYLETAAFERFSHPAFVAVSPIIDIPQQILETWTKLLENFAARLGVPLVNFVPSGYSRNRGIAYRRAEHTRAASLRSTRWFSSVQSRHAGL